MGGWSLPGCYSQGHLEPPELKSAFPVTSQATKLVGEGRWVSLTLPALPALPKSQQRSCLLNPTLFPSPTSTVGKSSAFRKHYMTN